MDGTAISSALSQPAKSFFHYHSLAYFDQPLQHLALILDLLPVHPKQVAISI